LKYTRAWSFLYDSNCDGVGIHADPAGYNVNVWVTPDECVLDTNKNGLLIWLIKPPKGMPWEEYNYNPPGVTEGHQPIKIPYKFNRAVIFDSKYFHKTDSVSMKEGLENRRINFTFLYESGAPR